MLAWNQKTKELTCLNLQFVQTNFSQIRDTQRFYVKLTSFIVICSFISHKFQSLPAVVAKQSKAAVFKNSSSEDSCLDPGLNPMLDYNIDRSELEISCH